MDENKDIKKIKKAFETQNKSAPKDLWAKLSEKMPDNDLNQTIDQKVKNGFENLNKTAPPHIWGTVNKKLNIDRVWEKIDADLNRQKNQKKRRVAVLFILLFLLGTAVWMNLNHTQVPYLTLTSDKIRVEADHKTESVTNRSIEATTNNIVVDNAIPEKNKNNTGTDKRKEKAKYGVAITNPTANISQVLKGSSKNILNNKNASRMESIQNSPDFSSDNSLEKPGTFEKPDTSLLADFLISKPFDFQSKIHDELLLTDTSHNIIPDSLLEKIIPKFKRKKFELGLTYSFNNTWILDNETRESFDENSLIQSIPSYASSYGLVANYNISRMNALSAEFYFNSKIRQNYNEFVEGGYYRHLVELNYSKFILLYQLNLTQKRAERIPTRFTFKAGFYGSYLWNSWNTYNAVVESGAKSFAHFDYGVKLAIGQEKQFGNIILGYGLNSEYGLNNNFAGNSQIPSKFDLTKNALIGAYVNLKYNF